MAQGERGSNSFLVVGENFWDSAWLLSSNSDYALVFLPAPPPRRAVAAVSGLRRRRSIAAASYCVISFRLRRREGVGHGWKL